LLIRELRTDDWPAVRAIYEAGIATGNATFETQPPAWGDWDAAHLPGARLVAEEDGRLVGWAALSPVSARCVYEGVAEDSVYVAPRVQRRGVGRKLLEELVAGAEAAGIWTIQTSIFPENEASLALHRRCGFRVVGVRERIASLDGVWRDTVLMERRSRVAGVGPIPNPHPPTGQRTVEGKGARVGDDFAPGSSRQAEVTTRSGPAPRAAPG
jgi:L-amino acid N-acyltransferase YncA